MLVDALIGLLSRGLYLLPAGLTGRVRGTAKQLVREALSKNATGQELRFNLLERLLLVGGNHPLVFALGVGLLSAAVAWVTLPLPQFGWPGLPAPKLPDDFTLAGFFGSVWGVQATMVALVYPIVITFVTILLQRRATAKAALSVYVLYSGVLPAGTSSLLLVAVMAIEYLASPYAPTASFVWAIAFNGVWLMANLGLTGYFLIKTVRFVQDEESNQAYLRLAVSSVLPQQLTVSLARHLTSRAPSLRPDRFPAPVGDALRPSLYFLSLGTGKPEVVRRFGRPAVLVDVHLNLVSWAYRRWLRRDSSVKKVASGSRSAKRKRAVIPC